MKQISQAAYIYGLLICVTTRQGVKTIEAKNVSLLIQEVVVCAGVLLAYLQ